jgi:hypothetical protein
VQLGSRLLARALPLALIATGCAEPRSPAAPASADYLRWVSFEAPINENVLLRWPLEAMPLRVYLPKPPDGLFPDPDVIQLSVRDGVMDWADQAAPGVPSFVFVDAAGDADIRFRWAAQPNGDWYVAYCAYQLDLLTRRFGVEHILVTGRWKDGRLADMHDVYSVVLHEMGHALGLGGHSPDAADVMFATGTGHTGLSERDRATLRALYAKPIGARVTGARKERY